MRSFLSMPCNYTHHKSSPTLCWKFGPNNIHGIQKIWMFRTEMHHSMDKLHLTEQNLAWVLNLRSGHLHAAHLLCCRVKLPNVNLKTHPKQLLGYLPLDVMLPRLIWSTHAFYEFNRLTCYTHNESAWDGPWHMC